MKSLAHCDVTKKVVSYLGWDKLISDTRRLSRTPRCTRQIDLRHPALVSHAWVYEANRSQIPDTCFIHPPVWDKNIPNYLVNTITANDLATSGARTSAGIAMNKFMYNLLCSTQERIVYLVVPYGDRNLVNIGSGNVLVPDGTKPLPEPMLPYHQRCSVAFT